MIKYDGNKIKFRKNMGLMKSGQGSFFILKKLVHLNFILILLKNFSFTYEKIPAISYRSLQNNNF